MITLDAALYDRTQNLQGLLMQAGLKRYSPPTPPTPIPLLQLRRGLAESAAWFLIQAAEFEPEPLSVERLRVRAIWSSERIVAAILELMASEQWLARDGEEYHLLPEGQRLKSELQARPTRVLDALRPAVNEAAVAQLETLLAQIIANAAHSATPPGTWCLRYSRRRAPAESSHALLKLFHHCSDLNAFRDDAHMASWRDHGVPGYVWEAFSYVYREQANTAEALYSQLAYRGYSRLEFVGALTILTERGWVTANGEAHQVTAAGRAIHAKAEALTDEYFFAPWRQLGEAALEDLLATLAQVEAELTALASVPA